MDGINIQPLHPDFGASVTGLDLGEPLSEALVEEVKGLIDRYSLLHFPEQTFDDQKQLALTKALGEPEIEHVKLGQEGKVDYFGTIGNAKPDGGKFGNREKRTIFQTGNNMWHSDSSFREVPSYVSIICAYEVPDEGGETEFVSCRAAYKRLKEPLKARIDPLIAIHDYVYSRTKIAPDAVTPSHAASLPPVRQKLVRRNPATGEKNIYIGSHAKLIVGWEEEESRSLLDELLEGAARPQDIYSHRWQVGDLVIWDNRCLLHRGAGYDADRYRRLMRQTRVSGAGSTLVEP